MRALVYWENFWILFSFHSGVFIYRKLNFNFVWHQAYSFPKQIFFGWNCDEIFCLNARVKCVFSLGDRRKVIVRSISSVVGIFAELWFTAFTLLINNRAILIRPACCIIVYCILHNKCPKIHNTLSDNTSKKLANNVIIMVILWFGHLWKITGNSSHRREILVCHPPDRCKG